MHDPQNKSARPTGQWVPWDKLQGRCGAGRWGTGKGSPSLGKAVVPFSQCPAKPGAASPQRLPVADGEDTAKVSMANVRHSGSPGTAAGTSGQGAAQGGSVAPPPLPPPAWDFWIKSRTSWTFPAWDRFRVICSSHEFLLRIYSGVQGPLGTGEGQGTGGEGSRSPGAYSLEERKRKRVNN